MKITVVMGFFLPMPPVAGGATEKSWHRLALEFVREGHEVTIVSRRWRGWPDRETRDGVKYLRLRGANHTSRLARNLWLDFWWSVRVWFSLPPSDVTVINSVALPVALGWMRGRAGRLVVMTGRMPKGQYRFYRRLDRVLAVSSPVRAAILAENPACAPVSRVCGYPIDWTTLSRPRPPPAPGAPVTIGFVGRIHREKGLDLFAAALGELARKSGLPRWRVVLCGPQEVAQGGSGEAYGRDLGRALAAVLPADAFELRPPVFAADKLAELYRSIDVFCYPSLADRGETFGVAVAEAMAAGAVPVVSRLACFSDFVRAGENGESFDHKAADAPRQLANALASLLGDSVRRAQLAAAAQASVRPYDFPVFAARLLEDFSTLK
ncbi:MAG TPA: glycosyltransferase family 4 protein [Opitutaceae bacterium]|nr:glycosyltransferase family 4 protein [Opitutaceae bacterium]